MRSGRVSPPRNGRMSSRAIAAPATPIRGRIFVSKPQPCDEPGRSAWTDRSPLVYPLANLARQNRDAAGGKQTGRRQGSDPPLEIRTAAIAVKRRAACRGKGGEHGRGHADAAHPIADGGAGGSGAGDTVRARRGGAETCAGGQTHPRLAHQYRGALARSAAA